MQIDNMLIIKTINNLKKSFLSKKLILLEYYSNSIVAMLNLESSHFSELNNVLVYSKDILNQINNCINNCDLILELLEKNSNNFHQVDKLFNEIIEFSTKIDELLKNNLIKTIPLLDKPISSNDTVEVAENNTTNTDETNKKNIDDLEDNNILLISEKKNKVFLPYKISDLNKILKSTSSFKNLQELINANYIIPLENYQNSVVARFREAFSLIKEKEKGNVFSAIELGLELAFNYSLNPAIISACRNSDELDIYLACLEENELQKFDLFEIKYEMNPR